jgi:hypothetical protein
VRKAAISFRFSSPQSSHNSAPSSFIFEKYSTESSVGSCSRGELAVDDSETAAEGDEEVGVLVAGIVAVVHALKMDVMSKIQVRRIGTSYQRRPLLSLTPLLLLFL